MPTDSCTNSVLDFSEELFVSYTFLFFFRLYTFLSPNRIQNDAGRDLPAAKGA